MKNKIKKILFICKYNRFRSRIAKSYFEKINKEIKADSAGLFIGSSINPDTVKIAKKFKLDISGKPRGISSKLLKKQDLIVIVADNVPSSIFKGYGAKIINLKIPDTKENKKKEIERIIKKIIKKIDNLNKQLENEN